MATRKVSDDPMARTEAERKLGDVLKATGVIDSASDEPTEAGRSVLDDLAVAVEWERGESRDPDRKVVPMRRMVITTAWEVDPERVGK